MRRRAASLARIAAACACACVCACAGAAPLLRAAPAVAAWRAETLAPAGVLAPLALSFDAAGDGLLLWQGNPNALQPPRSFDGGESHAPAGAWSATGETPFADVEQLQLYGRGRAMLIGSETLTAQTGPPASATPPCCAGQPGTVTRVRVLYADGSAAGAFGPARSLDDDGGPPVSAADARGDAIVAWVHGSRYRVAERSAGGAFSKPASLPGRALAGYPLAVALNERGARVLAWVQGGALYARLRQAHGPWGAATLVQRLPVPARPVPAFELRAAIAPSGVAVLAWESASSCEGCSTVLRAGVARHAPGRGWRTFTLEHAPVSPSSPGGAVGAPLASIAPLVDSLGRVYVVWTGALEGAPIVKLAQLSATGVGLWTALSDSLLGARLDGAVAGPQGSLLVSWSYLAGPTSGVGPVYASLRRGGERFALCVQLTGANVTADSGLVAFQPLSGEALVLSGVIVAGASELQVSRDP